MPSWNRMLVLLTWIAACGGLWLPGILSSPAQLEVFAEETAEKESTEKETAEKETAEKETDEPDRWILELMMDVVQASEVTLSADGKWVFYTAREAMMEPGQSEYRTQIWRSAADGSSTRQMTFDEAGASSPALSPDGSRLAFLSSRAGRNVFVMRADGGEAWPLTRVDTGVGSFLWTADSRRIVYTAGEGPSEEDQAKAKDKNDARVVGEIRGNAHLWVVDLPEKPGTPGESKRLTEGDFHVDPVYQWGLDVSPDGSTVVFARSSHPRINDWTTADLYTVDVESGEMKPLVTGSAAASDPHYSPDGRWIAFGISDAPPSWPFQGDIAVVPAEGGEPRILAHTHDRNRTQILGWSADGERVYFEETRGTLTRIAYLPFDGSPAVDLDIGERFSASAAWSPKAERLAFVGESFYEPPEIYVLDPSAGAEPIRVSELNDHLPDLPLPKAEVIRWKSADGLEIEGILIHPLEAPEGPAPLLLNVHGGPIGVYRQQFLAGPTFHPPAVLAAEGFAVLRPNFRGSSGYGRDFRFANQEDWGGGDYQDLMTGVDHLVEKGIADPDRLGVMGWSYGGYMSSWIITQTDRFRAAAIGAPVTNLMSFTGTADIPDFVPNYFGGEFWQQSELFQARSPMFQIANASTPALILHGEADHRVPLGQAQELHTALDRMGVETELVVYPRMPHGPAEPRHLLDLAQRHVDWFRHHVLGADSDKTDSDTETDSE